MPANDGKPNKKRNRRKTLIKKSLKEVSIESQTFLSKSSMILGCLSHDILKNKYIPDFPIASMILGCLSQDAHGFQKRARQGLWGLQSKTLSSPKMETLTLAGIFLTILTYETLSRLFKFCSLDVQKKSGST